MKHKRLRFIFFICIIFGANAMAATKDSVIIDVRTEPEWVSGHLKNAVHIPLVDIGDKIKSHEPNLDKEIMLYCRSGNRSGKAKIILEDLGYTNVKNIGGISAASKLLDIKIIK